MWKRAVSTKYKNTNKAGHSGFEIQRKRPKQGPRKRIYVLQKFFKKCLFGLWTLSASLYNGALKYSIHLVCYLGDHLHILVEKFTVTLTCHLKHLNGFHSSVKYYGYGLDTDLLHMRIFTSLMMQHHSDITFEFFFDQPTQPFWSTSLYL